MNVAYYSDALATGNRYGLSRYAWELFNELRQLISESSVRPVSAHVQLTPTQIAEMTQRYGFVPLPWPRKFVAGCWSTLGFPRLERWTPWADVVHCVELDYRVSTKKPFLVTVHDLGPLTHPHFFSTSHPWLLRTALRHAARHAAAIICVSQATADAVEGCLRQSLGERLRVIPEGVSSEFFQAAPVNCFEKTAPFMETGQPFFLWAGSLNPRKNLATVIAAFEQVAAQIPHHLVVTGGIGWDAEPIVQRVHGSALRSRIHLPGRVADSELRGLYQRATAFLYPSLMEGFGLPILEAMASECPVITSNLSSMPEVAGDAAILVDPHDPGDLAAAMQCLATDETFARRLRYQGRARVEDFRWDRCARAVADIYQEVARSKRAPAVSPGKTFPALPALIAPSVPAK